jgi:Cytidylyltransferase-like
VTARSLLPVARRGAFPGSFNPLTHAHLAVAEAARLACGLDRVDLCLSRVALDKKDVSRPLLEHRLEVLRRVVQARPWLGVVVSEVQLVVDLAAGYDAVIVGSDKWAQVTDPFYYGGSLEARDAALARLPMVVVVHRPGFPPPESHEWRGTLVPLDVAPEMGEVSSTGARAGRSEWMVPEAAAFDRESGAWSDPVRYEQWLARIPGGPG